MSLTFVLPVLVAIFGLIGIYGSSGWLAWCANLFGMPWQGHIYGLSGILIAHLFSISHWQRSFSCKVCKVSLISNVSLQRKLNLQGWQFVKLVEWPVFRQQCLPTFSLIFMLCFTSFTVVLTLGGGPQYTTLETAIYQAILFEFDLPKAALFVHVTICILLGFI